MHTDGKLKRTFDLFLLQTQQLRDPQKGWISLMKLLAKGYEVTGKVARFEIKVVPSAETFVRSFPSG